MTNQIQLGDILVDVAIKNIKHIHLSVHPPHGQVRISAPRHIPFDTLRLFSASKVDWIKKQQLKLRNHIQAESPPKYLDLESHFLWGNRFKSIMSTHMPEWQQYRRDLNSSLLPHAAGGCVEESLHPQTGEGNETKISRPFSLS